MATGIVSWSQTAASNASADSTVNWAEGQAPSTVNDSARALMASAAKYRDDIAGAIATSGTSTAYTLSSFQGFGALSALHQQIIAFTPHTTCGATVTLNVDSLGAKPLRSSPSVELAAGTLIQGTPYLALYNNSDGAFYLHGFLGNSPYYIPIGAGVDYWGSSAPNSSFAFPVGQAISRTTYAILFGLIGTTFGTGDGSTTFNLPDKRGRLGVPADNMGGSQANRVNLVLSNAVGSVGGEQQHTLTAGEIPTITSGGTNTINVASTVGDVIRGSPIQTSASPSINEYGLNVSPAPVAATINSTGSNSIAVTSNNTSGSSHNNVQPSIVCNYIMRII